MHLGRLIFQEIRYRKLNFALGMLGVIVAVGCAVGLLSTLRRYDAATQQIIEQRRDDTASLMRDNEEKYRRITLAMGFNMVILHKQQSVADFYVNNVATTDMDEAWADRIAKAKLTSVNHVTPVLQKRVRWDEMNREIFLTGTRIAYVQAGAIKRPIQQDVRPGTMILGNELQRSGLKKDQKVRLLGREFTIAGFKPGQYNKDDITVWINLKDAQELLNKPGKINGIFAIECTGCGPEAFDVACKEIGDVLPDAQVIEFVQLASLRNDSRRQAAAMTQIANDREIQHRDQVSRQQQALAKVLIPLMLAGCAVWIGLLTFMNVRDRGSEIGVFRAIGLGSGRILALFLVRAALMGIAGACAGYFGGAFAGRLFHGETTALVDGRWLLGAMIAAPILAAVAAAAPAIVAAFSDPAILLRED